MFESFKKLSSLSGRGSTSEGISPKVASLDTLRNMRILLVDDMPTNIILMRAILEHGGFRNILTADNGKKALEYINADTQGGVCGIDLILLDIIMPSADGFYVCRKMQSQLEWRQVPIIMITSENKWREETARASFDSGATDIMFKPVRSIELIPRVISALTQKYERDSRLQKEQSLQQQLDKYRRSEEKLNYLINHDELTGLYNRRGLLQALDLAIAHAKHSGKAAALLYIDIDNYRLINATNGPEYGDRLLIDVAGKIRDTVVTDSFLARVTNDEFALLLLDTSSDNASNLARQISHACAEIQVGDADAGISLTLSIGIKIFTDKDSPTSGGILVGAEQASYMAKQADNDSILISAE